MTMGPIFRFSGLTDSHVYTSSPERCYVWRPVKFDTGRSDRFLTLFSSEARYVEIIRNKKSRERIRIEIEGSSLSLSSAGVVCLV